MSVSNETHFCGKIAQKAIIEQDGKVLLIRDPRMNDVIWEIPGGRMNEGEEPREALAREVFEELGLSVSVHEVVHLEQFMQASEGKNAFVIVYRATLDDSSKTIVPDTREICEVKWFDRDEVHSVTLFPEYKRALETYFNTL